jgi:hypothetical protein
LRLRARPRLPTPTPTEFNLDPEFKRESLWTGSVLKPAVANIDTRFGLWLYQHGLLRPLDAAELSGSPPRSPWSRR